MDELETEYELEDNFKDFQPLPLEVSRGCIFKCAFCSHPFLGKKSYDYIRSPESLAKEIKRNYELFKTTRYSPYLIKNNKIVNEDDFFNLSDNDGNKIQLNLKNIYNISKTLSHKEINDNWIIYPEIFNSLDKEDIKIFYNRIGLLSTDETENKYKLAYIFLYLHR